LKHHPNPMPYNDIYQWAEKSLKANLVMVSGDQWFTAGASQFKTFWVRDFCYSFVGLRHICEPSFFKRHLDFLLNNLNDQGQVPLYVDSIKPVYRVGLASLMGVFGLKFNIAFGRPRLKSFYYVNTLYPVIDSNLLVIKTLCDYCLQFDDKDYFESKKNQIKRVLDFYNKANLLKEDFIYQGPFSDWMDSISRQGVTFLTQLLLWHVQDLLLKLEAPDQLLVNQESLKNKITKEFFNSDGFYESELNRKGFIALADQLVALDWGFVLPQDQGAFFARISQYSTYKDTKTPFWCSYPKPQSSDLISHVKWIGLSHYHSHMTWSWIVGLYLKLALKMGGSAGNPINISKVDLSSDLAGFAAPVTAPVTVGHTSKTEDDYVFIIEQLKSWSNEPYVAEIYDSQSLKPFKNCLYKSEAPFSWGAAFIMDALSTRFF